jgi:hypothetical protein
VCVQKQVDEWRLMHSELSHSVVKRKTTRLTVIAESCVFQTFERVKATSDTDSNKPSPRHTQRDKKSNDNNACTYEIADPNPDYLRQIYLIVIIEFQPFWCMMGQDSLSFEKQIQTRRFHVHAISRRSQRFFASWLFS